MTARTLPMRSLMMVALTIAPFGAAPAQELEDAFEPIPIHSGTATGISVGLIGEVMMAYQLPMPVVGFQVSRLRGRGGFAPEGTLHVGLPLGAVLVLVPEASLAYDVPFAGGMLVLKAGGNVFLASYGAERRFVPGGHLGAGLIIPAAKELGIRWDITQRLAITPNAPVTWGVSIGLTRLPGRPNR